MDKLHAVIPRILLIEPNRKYAEVLIKILPAHEIHHFLTIEEVSETQIKQSWRLIIYSWSKATLTENNENLEILKEYFSNTPILLAASSNKISEAAKIEDIFDCILRPYISAEVLRVSRLTNMLSGLSKDIPYTIENFEEHQKQRALRKLAQELNISYTPDYLRESAALLSRLLLAESFYLLRFDNRTNKLEAIVNHGPHKLTHQVMVSGIFAKIFEKNVVINLSGPNQTEETKDALKLLSKTLNLPHLKNCLLAPLARKDDVFGVVIVANRTLQEAAYFSSTSEGILQGYAEQIVERMARDSQNQALRSLLDVSARVISASDGNEVLSLITNLLVEKLDYRVAYLRFLLPNKGLRIFATAGTSKNYLNNPSYDLTEGQGIAGFVMKTKKPITVRDVHNTLKPLPDFYFSQLIEDESLRSLVSVPVFLDNQIIGTLSCYTGRTCNFSQKDVQLLEIFANLAATAYANSKSMGTLLELEKAGEIFSTKTRTEDLLTAIVENIPSQVYGDGAFICTFDSQNQRFNFNKSISIGLGMGLVAWNHDENQHAALVRMVRNTSTVVVRDISDISDPPSFLRIDDKTRQSLLESNINSFIGARLQVQEGESPVGILFINYQNKTLLSKFDEVIHVLRIYADQAALSIKRVQEHERVINEHELLKSLAYATSDIIDVKETCQKILEGAVRITGAVSGNMGRIYPGTELLRDVAQYGEIWVNEQRDLRASKLHPEGIMGWVAVNKKPALMHNLHDPKWKDQYFDANPGTKSELAVPILDKISGNLVGIINLESPQESAFDEEDLELVQVLALHAAIAIQNADRRERLTRYFQQLKALQDSIVLSKNSLDRSTMLQTILIHAAGLTNAHFATIQKVEDDKLFFEAVYPKSYLEPMLKKIGRYLPMNDAGLTVQVAKSGKPLYVKDVRTGPHQNKYIDSGLGTTISELTVPLKYKDSIWGVINVEAESPDAFDEEDVDALEALGIVAVTALESANYAKELSRTNALAVMGAWGAEIVHDINRAVGKIRNATHFIRNANELSDKLLEKLTEVDNNLDKLIMPPIPSNLNHSFTEFNEAYLDKIVEAIIQASALERSDRIKLISNLNCSNVQVAINQNWLFHLLKHLVHNAIQAIEAEGDIFINTTIDGQRAVFTIRDTGSGIQENIRQSLFLRPINHGNSELTGNGLLLVGYIAEQYGGVCRLVHTEVGKGATFELRLPLTD